MNFPIDMINTAKMYSDMCDALDSAKEKERIEEEKRIEKNMSPIVNQLQQLVSKTQVQNKILAEQNQFLQEENRLQKEQNMLLIEENERQKKQVEDAKVAETQAKKEALHSKVFGWVSFGIATAISIAALVVSIIALF